MIKKTLFISIGLAIGGIILFLFGFLIDRNLLNRYDRYDVESVEKQRGTITGDFSKIDIEVIAANVTISTGEKFSVEYEISNKEKILKAEVSNGVLEIKTRKKKNVLNWLGVDYYTGNINITVPKDTKLENVSIDIVSGDLSISGLQINTVELDLVSSDMQISENDIKDITISQVNGNININSNKIGEINIESVNTDCVIESEISEASNIEMVNGNIKTNLGQLGVRASTISGKIYFNGQECGKNFIQNKEKDLTISIVNGNIELN